MRSLRAATIAITLILVLSAGCAGPAQQKTIYWRGEMWDGLNRMVFALQDLDWHLDTVDTDSGRIVASRAREGRGGSEAERPDSAGESLAAPGDFYRIIVQFPEGGDTPVSIRPEDQNDEAYRSGKFLRMIGDIKKRFEWYGGKSVEVVG
jgi:hypothetical protein